MIRRPCKKCSLHRFRKKIVQGRGLIPADILFIGEAPGKAENITGEAFTGRSGKLLNQMIKDATPKDWNLSVYITNTVFCRPTDSKQGDNRQPTPEEVLACSPNLYELIGRVKPKQIIFAGKVSESYYKKEFPDAVAIQHPAFLLRQGGKSSPYYLTNIRVLTEVFERWEED